MNDLPSNPTTEAAILACVMLDPGLMGCIRGLLTGEEFTYPLYAKAWKACVTLSDDHKQTDFVAVTHKMKETGELSKDEYATLSHIMSEVLTTSNWRAYVDLLRSTKVRRDLLRNFRSLAAKTEADHQELLAAMQSSMFQAHDYLEAARETTVPYSQLFDRACGLYERRVASAQKSRVSLGLNDLDKITGGVQEGQFIIVAGYSNSGKTMLCGQICEEVARAGLPVLFISLEMSWEQLIDRSVSRRTGIEPKRLQTGRFDNTDRTAIVAALAEISALPITIQYRGEGHIHQILSSAKMQLLREGIKLVVVDYIQLVKTSKTNSRREEVSLVSRELKHLAHDLGVTVIGVSQLRRSEDARPGRPEPRPSKFMLKESGDVENDADAVFLVWRPENYVKYDNVGNVIVRPLGELEPVKIIVDKQRTGPAPVDIPVLLDTQSMKFLNATHFPTTDAPPIDD